VLGVNGVDLEDRLFAAFTPDYLKVSFTQLTGTQGWGPKIYRATQGPFV
jgi:hypothetical protein